MPLRIQIKAIGGLLKGRGPKEVVQPAVGDPNEMGFSAFYAAVLSHVSLMPCCSGPARLSVCPCLFLPMCMHPPLDLAVPFMPTSMHIMLVDQAEVLVRCEWPYCVLGSSGVT